MRLYRPVLIVAICLHLCFQTIAVSLRVERSSSEQNHLTLYCDESPLNSLPATFFRNSMPIRQGETDSLSHTINRTTEGLFHCELDGVSSPNVAIVAFPVMNGMPSEINGTWGHLEVDCPFQGGVLTDFYNMTWHILKNNGESIEISKTITSENYQLIEPELSLNILHFNPLSNISQLTCELKVTSHPNARFQGINPVKREGVIKTISLIQDKTGTAMFVTPLKSVVTNSGMATFNCTASVPMLEEVVFEIFGQMMDTDNCTTDSTIRNCSNNIDGRTINTMCDYSKPYQQSCTLTARGLRESDSTNVLCTIMKNGKQAEEPSIAGLAIGVNKLTSEPQVCMNADSLLINVTLPTMPKYGFNVSFRIRFTSQSQSQFINYSTSLTVNKRIIQIKIQKDNPDLSVILAYQEPFTVSVKMRYDNEENDFNDKNYSNESDAINAAVSSTVTVTTGPIIPSSSPPPMVSSSKIIIIGSVIAVVILMVLIVLVLIFLLAYFRIHKKTKMQNKISRDSSQRAEIVAYMPKSSPNLISYHGYHGVGQNSPSPSPSPGPEDFISQTGTDYTRINYSEESTPSHRSHQSHTERRSNSPSNRNTSHYTNAPGSYSNTDTTSRRSHPSTLNFPRYGYPDADISHPRIGIIPPTPNSPPETPATPETLPFAPSPGTPINKFSKLQHSSPQRPHELKIKTEGSDGLPSTTPISDEVALSIATFLMHKNCADRESCQTCYLIETRFQHLMQKYETSRIKHFRREQKVHREQKVRKRPIRYNPRTLQPPQFGRQRSMSTSEINPAELTMSSNEESTDEGVVTEPETRVKSRDFSPLPINAIPRELTASDSHLASTPSGQIPSPRRIFSSTKSPRCILGAPMLQSRKDSLQSNDSLQTDESETSSRHGSDTNIGSLVTSSLQKPLRKATYSTTSGYETNMSDTESLFRPNIHKYGPLDKEMQYRRKRQNGHPPPRVKRQQNAINFSNGRAQEQSSQYSQNLSVSNMSVRSDVVKSTYSQECVPRPSSSSPYHSKYMHRNDHQFHDQSSVKTHLAISLPKMDSKQTDL